MNQAGKQIQEIAVRIREMRQIMGYSTLEMALRTQVSEATYKIMKRRVKERIAERLYLI